MWIKALFTRFFHDEITGRAMEKIAKIQRLEFSEARRIAEILLKNPTVFRCVESTRPFTLPSLPSAVSELFAHYSDIELIGRDTWLRRNNVGHSVAAPLFQRIGHSDLGGGDVEVCVLSDSEKVYDLDGSESNDSERERESLPSIYHWLILQADFDPSEMNLESSPREN